MAAPFTLPWGAKIVARVTAINVYGSSVVSAPTASDKQAVILRSPDAPLNLANNLQITFGTSIGLTWSQGLQNGGTPVTSYTLWSDQGSNGNSFQPIASGLLTPSYTVTGLSLGTYYIFKVTATNAWGTSDYSATVTILAAQQPNVPLPPVTIFLRGTSPQSYSAQTDTSVQVTWTAPYNGGSPITGYRVQF